MVGRELLGVAAEHVARELVEQDHRGERGQRIGQKGIDRKLPFFRPQLEEALLDPVVERRIGRSTIASDRAPNQNLRTSERQSSVMRPPRAAR